jgi:hypothetical protein
MNKTMTLKLIAETAYNVGYGAKLNFATLDIIEKMPGFLGFTGLAVGIYSLFVPTLTTNHVAATMVLLGVITLYLAMYLPDRQRYDETGKALTGQFNELKRLYYTTKSRPDTADFHDLLQAHDAIQSKTVSASVSKQVLFSDWYAHYKFFWQQQIDWLDEQKNFRLFRDKVPLTAWFAIGAIAAAAIYLAARKLNFISCLQA